MKNFLKKLTFSENKKGLLGLGQLVQIILMLVIIGIMLVVGLKIMGGVRDEMTSGTAERNASDNAMEGLTNVSEQQGLLGTIIIFGVILGVVVLAFMVKGAL